MLIQLSFTPDIYIYYTFPGVETYCVIVDKIVYRVKSMITSNNYDIVKAAWLIKCIEATTFIPWFVFHFGILYLPSVNITH